MDRTDLPARLASPEAAAALVGLAFDFALEQPVERYLDAAQLLDHAALALNEAAVERTLREHLRPALEREIARAKTRGDKVGDWLTAEALAELRALAAKPVRLERRFLEGLVQQPAVQHMLRSVVQETLDRFLATLKPGGSGGGMLGAVGRGAVGLASSFGKGILGGVGAQIEAQLKGAATSFINGSMNLMMERLVAILSSPETASHMGRMNLAGFEAALKLSTYDVLKNAEKLPLDDLLDVVPGLITHNLERPEVRAGLLEELEAALKVEGARPVRELLEDGGLVEPLRARVLAVAVPLVQTFAQTEAFRGWLDG